MADEPKYGMNDPGPDRERPFVGRQEEIALFKEALHAKFGATKTGEDKVEPTVLVFHGVAGIGKTELRKKLAEELEADFPKAIWTVLDFYEERNRAPDHALFRLRMNLRTSHKVSSPGFDLAYALWWKKANPQIPLNKQTFPLWGETGLLGDVIGLAGELPLVGLVPKAGQVIEKSRTSLRGWWQKRGAPALSGLQSLEAYEVADLLPMFLVEDIKNHLTKFPLPIVLFLDTYEALWGKERDESTRYAKDKWVRGFVRQLPEALWVISGRGELCWLEREPEWENSLVQHETVRLSSEHALQYLEECAVDNKEIRETVYAGSEGVPLYLALSVETFEAIKYERKRVPQPDDFGKTYNEIFDRFVRNLKENELVTLKVLSAARSWDRGLFELLVKDFGTNYPLPKYKEFCRLSFIRHDAATDAWTMHELMRDHLQQHLKSRDPELHRRIQQSLYEYYHNQLGDVDIKTVSEKHDAAFIEAFHHAANFMGANNLFDWVREESRLFADAARWQMLVTVYLATIHILADSPERKDTNLAVCLNNLGMIYKEQGKYVLAESLYQRALAINEDSLGRDHFAVATNLNNLAQLYMISGKFEQAERLFKRALMINEKHFGIEYRGIAINLNNLAELYRMQGKYAQAEELFRRALQINEKSVGKDHGDIAVTLNNIALIYRAQGKYTQAEQLFLRALAIDEKTLGMEHPDVATALNNLAELYRDQRRYPEAERLYKRALQITTKALGKEHGDVTFGLNNLALLYHAQMRYEEAERLYLRALEILERTLPADHPNILTTLRNMVMLCRDMGKEDEARKYERRAQEIQRKRES